MNEDELRGALSELAGPPAQAGGSARAAVAGRVRRARRRIAAGSSALAIVVAVGAVGVAQSSAFDGGSRSPRVDVSARPGRCTKVPPTVARRKVPAAIRRQLSSGAIVGGGTLWTSRRVLKQTPVVEGPITRLKIGWFVDPLRADTPPPVLTAREVNGPGRATGDANRATDARGTWFASTIELTGTDTCWEITARAGNDVIRFRRSTGTG
jgi:hypothetical protein